MSSPSSRRIAGLAGIAFVVLFLVAFVGLTPTDGVPDSGDTPQKVAAYVQEHRNTLLAGYAVLALSGLAIILFIAGLLVTLRRDGAETLWVVTAAVGGLISGGTFLAGLALLEASAFRPASDPQIQQALRDAGFLAFNTSGIGLAALVGALALSSNRVAWLGGWTLPFGLVVAVLQALGAATLKGDGAMSPEGVVAVIAAVSFAVWALVISVLALRAPEGEVAAPAG
jgi:hypothetical protein